QPPAGSLCPRPVRSAPPAQAVRLGSIWWRPACSRAASYASMSFQKQRQLRVWASELLAQRVRST
ncbi:unnamed protein product, partial [Amoebophrya sp. A120]